MKLEKSKHCAPSMEQILDELDFFKDKFDTLYISSDKKIDRQVFEERGRGFIKNKLLLIFFVL